MLFMMLFFMAIYIALSFIFIVFVKKLFKKPLYKWLAVAFVILFPTWDVVFGYLAYYPACFIISKAKIYEKADTKGIYYEGIDDLLRKEEKLRNEIGEYKLTVMGAGWIDYGLEKGYQIIEYLGDEKTQIYRCTKLKEKSRINEYATVICVAKNSIESRYAVKIRKIRIGTLEINLKKVYDRTSGKLMAEYNRVSRWSYFNFLTVPFFNWLEWADYSEAEGSVHCPFNDCLDPFEYKVLRPVK